jgi:hypothetical protein
VLTCGIQELRRTAFASNHFFSAGLAFSFLEKMLTQVVKKFHAFLELKGSAPRSQNPAVFPCS